MSVHKELTSEEYKKVIKNLLKYVHDFCKENSITYYIGYGTLLGAVRHKGFIPWDDDIDIMMTRDNYNKFIELFNTGNKRYYTLTPEYSEYYYNNFARICDRKCVLELEGTENIDNLGAFIDLFPIDRVPIDREERKLYYSAIRESFLDILYSLPLRYFKTTTKRRRIRFLFNIIRRIKCRYIIGTAKAKKKRDELLIKYNNTETCLFSVLYDNPKDDYNLYTHELNETCILPFEDIEISAPLEYDSILRREYGNYMILPDEKDRLSKHHFKAYWNNSFIRD